MIINDFRVPYGLTVVGSATVGNNVTSNTANITTLTANTLTANTAAFYSAYNTTTLTLTANNAGFGFVPYSAAGSFNAIVQAGDALVYSSNGVADVQSLSIGPWSVRAGGLGIRIATNTQDISAAGNTFSLTTNTKLNVSGSVGSTGQILYSNGVSASPYWAAIPPAVTSIVAGSGLSGGTIASSGTIAAVPGNGISVTSSINVVAGNTQLVSNTSGLYVNSAAISLSALNGYNANQLIDHTAVSVIAGTGLSGGGTINGNVTLAVNTAYIATLSSNYATSAGSAAAVAWTAVTGRPTNVSSFTNDAGYITSSGSTLTSNNASYLGGNAPSYYTNIPSLLGYTPVQQSGGTGQGTNKVYIGWLTGSVLGLQVDATNFGSSWPISVTGNAATASAVAWTGVSGRPTNVSSFTNDAGYITAAGSASYATSAGSAAAVAWTAVTGRPTNVSSFTNDSGYITSAGSASYATSAGTASALATSSNYQMNSLGVGTGPSGTAGTILATNNITAYYSDMRLKDISGTIDNPLDKVLKLTGVYFTSNKLAESYGFVNKDQQVGVIAQEVKAVMPEVIDAAPFDTAYDMFGKAYSKSGENYMTVHYDRLVPLLIEAIKELKLEIDELKSK